MVAFLVGVTIARYVFVRPPGQQASAGQTQDFTSQCLQGLDRLALLYLIVGAIVYFVCCGSLLVFPRPPPLWLRSARSLWSVLVSGFGWRAKAEIG